MSAGQKIAVSLLVSVILFAVFAVAAFAGLFSLVEARFYQPLLVKSIEQRLKTVAEKEEEYCETLDQRFSSFAAKKEIASYASATPSESTQKARMTLTGTLFSQTPSLTGIRIIDKNGRNIHYSSLAADEKFRSKSQVSYKNYTDLQDVPFESISCEDVRKGGGGHHHIIRDQKKNRVLYAYPFYDVYAVYRGTIVFYCDADDFNRFLTSQNIIALNENFVLVSNEVKASQKNTGGYVCGLPHVGKDLLTSTLLEKIAGKKDSGLEKIAVTEDGNWLAFIFLNQNGSFIARFIKDEALLFSLPVRILLLTIIFLTLFLAVFLIFNLRHDDMVVIKDRIRRFQIAFIDEYTEKNNAGTLKLLPSDLEQRKLALNTEIKRSLGKRAKRHEKEVNALLDRSWNEITGTLASAQGTALASPSTDTAEIKRMLEEVLQNGRLQIPSKAQESHTQPAVPNKSPAGQEVLAPAAKANSVGSREVPDEVETVEDIEPLDDAEEVEDIEPLDDAEEVADIEPLDDAEEAEGIEPLDDAEEAEDIEPLEDAEEVEDIEPLDDAEEAEDIEPLDDAEEAEDIEPLDDAEEAEDIESLDDAEEAADEKKSTAPVPPEKSDTEKTAAFLTKETPASQSVQKAEEEYAPVEEIVMMTEDEALTFSSPDPNDSEEDDGDNDLEFFEVVSPDEMFAINGDSSPVPSKEVLDKPLQEPEELPVLEPAEKRSRPRFSFWNFGRNDTPVTEVLTDSEEGAKDKSPSAEAKDVQKATPDRTVMPLKKESPADTIQEDASGIYHIAENLPLDSMKLDEKFKQLVDSVLR